MKLKSFEEFNESISNLDHREKSMVTGIAEILRMVKDMKNRKEIAEDQIKKFKKENVKFNYEEFLDLCGFQTSNGSDEMWKSINAF